MVFATPDLGSQGKNGVNLRHVCEEKAQSVWLHDGSRG